MTATTRVRRLALTSALVAAGFGAGTLLGVPGGAGADHDHGGVLDFDEAVFLSHVNTEGMPIFPGDPEFVLDDTFTVDADGFFLQTMTIGDHSGTHYGAPCHFNADQQCADALEAADFFHPAAVIDIRAQVAANPDYALSLADVKKYEKRHGRIPKDAVVIAYTGWQDRWSDPVAYFNEDAEGVMHYPGISAEATQWLIDKRELGGLGIDTHGVDPGADVTFLTNTLLLADHRIHIENMAGLDQLPAKGAWVVVGGVRNAGGSGSAATVFGLIP